MLGHGLPFHLTRLVDRIRGVRRRWFVSHAYQDADNLALMKRLLPVTIEPFVFPPIEVPPDKAVTGALIAAIRQSEALVYIQSAISDASFWVNFERRYARRIEMPVIVFDPTVPRFRRAEFAVGNTVALLWNEAVAQDNAPAVEIARWLHEQRRVYTERVFASFATQDPMWGYWYATRSEAATYGEDGFSLEQKLAELSAPIVALVSNATFAKPWPFADARCFVPDGDIISCGTAAGTAQDSSPIIGDGKLSTERFLEVGDVVEVASPRIGMLRSRIMAGE